VLAETPHVTAVPMVCIFDLEMLTKSGIPVSMRLVRAGREMADLQYHFPSAHFRGRSAEFKSFSHKTPSLMRSP